MSGYGGVVQSASFHPYIRLAGQLTKKQSFICTASMCQRNYVRTNWEITYVEKDKRPKTGVCRGRAGSAFLFCLLVTPVYTTVTMTFAEDPSGEVITTVYSGPRTNVSASDAKSRVVNSGVARIAFLISSMADTVP